MRDHSRAELVGKLSVYVGPADDLTALLDDLTTQGWLSDQRTADSLVRSRSSNWGASKLKHAMQVKGMSPDVIAQALTGLAETEAQRAAKIWRRKFSQPPADPSERAKQTRFLMARGFSAATVSCTLKKSSDILSGNWPDETASDPDSDA